MVWWKRNFINLCKTTSCCKFALVRWSVELQHAPSQLMCILKISPSPFILQRTLRKLTVYPGDPTAVSRADWTWEALNSHATERRSEGNPVQYPGQVKNTRGNESDKQVVTPAAATLSFSHCTSVDMWESGWNWEKTPLWRHFELIVLEKRRASRCLPIATTCHDLESKWSLYYV